jgi:signal transduction histidine kinase
MPLAFSFIVTACCLLVVMRALGSLLPVDVRTRALAAAALAVGLVVTTGACPSGLSDWPAVVPSGAMVVIALAAGLSWRIPDRMQRWATELGDAAMLAVAATGPWLDDGTPGWCTAVAVGACAAWVVAGIVTHRPSARAPSSHRATLPLLALGAFTAAALVLVGSSTLALAVASGCMTISLALDRALSVVTIGRALVLPLGGATVATTAAVTAGLPFDEHVLLPAIMGALMVDVVHHGRPPAARAERLPAAPPLEPLDVERETLAVLGKLANPLPESSDAIVLSLEHVFPGGRIELLRNPDTAQSTTKPGKRVDRELLAEVCRRGILVQGKDATQASDALPHAAALALRKLGSDVVLLPVTYETRIHGVLVVRDLPRREGMIAQARRFADLLGHRLEAQQLLTELQHKQSLATLGTFAAALVHDLRSPLATVRLDMQLVRRHSSPHDREALDEAIRAIDRVLADLSGTLDFTRPLALDLAAIDLAALVDEVVASHRAQAERQEVELRGPPRANEPVRVRGDRPRLLRVLENLLRNALEVSPSGSVVSVSLTTNHREVEIAFRDQGPGIDPSVCERVFEPFVTTKREGIGLGLAIVRKIVEAHKGRVGLESTVSVGTCMRVWLPRARE